MNDFTLGVAREEAGEGGGLASVVGKKQLYRLKVYDVSLQMLLYSRLF